MSKTTSLKVQNSEYVFKLYFSIFIENHNCNSLLLTQVFEISTCRKCIHTKFYLLLFPNTTCNSFYLSPESGY